jgi:UPF0716 protein FxsA
VLGRLFLLFTLVPLAELFLLIEIGGMVGVLPTIGLIAATGMLGAYLAKREGRKALASYQEALANGRMPEDGIVSALLILVGGVLLIAPGVITDVLGLALMIPPIRRGVAKLVMRRVQARIGSGELQVMHIGSGFGPGFGPGFGASMMDGGDGAGRVSGRAGVVDVEVVDTDKRS